ncbi:MAG: diacylglycerol kinase [Lysobacterales bacterium]|jgi:diacylglycerol kinase (ATP)
MKPGKTGMARLIKATTYSWKGIRAAFRHEAAFRQELLLVLVLFPASFWVARSIIEWVLLVIPLLLVLVVELLNSAIESVVDRISDQAHVLSGQAKDMGSAAVLFSLLIIVAAWAPITWTRFHA